MVVSEGQVGKLFTETNEQKFSLGGVQIRPGGTDRRTDRQAD